MNPVKVPSGKGANLSGTLLMVACNVLTKTWANLKTGAINEDERKRAKPESQERANASLTEGMRGETIGSLTEGMRGETIGSLTEGMRGETIGSLTEGMRGETIGSLKE